MMLTQFEDSQSHLVVKGKVSESVKMTEHLPAGPDHRAQRTVGNRFKFARAPAGVLRDP